jgi:hypothetical protein
MSTAVSFPVNVDVAALPALVCVLDAPLLLVSPSRWPSAKMFYLALVSR